MTVLNNDALNLNDHLGELTEVELDLVTGGDGPLIPAVLAGINRALESARAEQWRG